MKRKEWKIDCVIYDCDGVLFDTLETNKMLYNRIAGSAGRSPLTEDEVQFCHTHTVYESIHHLFRNDEALEGKAVEFWKHGIDARELVLYLKMEPNLMEVLSRLKELGIATAISTNRSTTMRYIMEEYGLKHYFDVVVSALDVEKPKPDPEGVEKILKALNLDHEKVVYVGDSEVDEKTARASGVKFIAYKNRELDADAFIDDHLRLLDFLANGQQHLRPQVCESSE